MQNTGTREPTIRKRPKANPSDAVPVTPSTQRMKPMPNHLGPEGFHAGEIAGDCMIVHVALHHRAKPDSQSPHTVMNTTTKALLDSVEFGHQALGNSLAFHREAVTARVRLHICVNPRKSKASGLPSPRRRRLSLA